MGEHAATGLEKWLLDKTGKDIYFWNFQVLMFFTLFEVGAVFFEVIPGTDIAITRFMVWGILIVVGIIKGYGIAAYFMHLKGCLLYTSPSPRDNKASRMPSSA